MGYAVLSIIFIGFTNLKRVVKVSQKGCTRVLDEIEAELELEEK